MTLLSRFSALVAVALLTGGCQAEQDEAPAAPDLDAVKAKIEASFPGATVTAISDAPMAGLIEVRINDREVAYTSPDGQYLLIGELFEMRESGPVSLEEERLGVLRQEAFEAMDSGAMVTFPADKPKAEVYAFTDVSCGYCRRMHQQMESYNALGITVHYLAFPRGGISTPAADLMAQVWCSSDRQQAMTDAKLAGQLKEIPKACDDPVAEQYDLGVRLGVGGTPAVFTAEGEQLGGYLSPGDLAMRLGLGRE
jgi:thiol:disulfide interchange protein DsbC